MQVQLEQPKAGLKSWWIWSIAATFFAAHYCVRVLPGSYVQELMQHFQITATQVGQFGGLFYWPYLLMQVPAGLLVDRFGPRKLVSTALCICAASCMMFVLTESFAIASLARFLFGFSAAAAFISSIKLATCWFPPTQLAMVVGLSQALGMAGGAIASSLGAHFAFNQILISIAALFGVLLFFSATSMRDKPNGDPFGILAAAKAREPKVDENENKGPFFKTNVLPVIKCPLTWYNAFYAGLINAPTLVIGEFWGVEILNHIQEIPVNSARQMIGLIFIGWGIGGPLAGVLADRIGRKRVMQGSALLSTICLPIILWPLGLPIWLISGTIFFYGVVNTGLIASYTIASESFSGNRSGFSMSIANMMSITIGAFALIGTGKLLDLAFDGTIINDMPVYTAAHYQQATGFLPLLALIAFGLSFLVKETLVGVAEK